MEALSREKDKMILLKRAIKTIDKLKSILNEKEKNEPIAVIGMACRFPGGCDTPEKFWEFLKYEKNGVVEAPVSRWKNEDYDDNASGIFEKIYTYKGGFLQDDVAQFDSKFFGISPREAIEMDPQQRMLLEVSWEALERSGQKPERLKRSQTGVYIGIINNEYAWIPRNPMKLDKYLATGTPSSIASGRIAYTFGFNGPALSIDTACSSSLVAVHLACESLKKKESDMALAGGVNLMLSPLSTMALCMMNAISKDGKCKAFDSKADGYVRSEGCGIVVLKRLTTARDDGDNILATINGSAMNHNGMSSGLTVPSGLSQKEMLKAALRNAKIDPDQLDYLEAHGTGTELGDPIEINAVSEIFNGKTSRKTPLIIGSVKTNIGHLEGAAGIAGLIKTILCLENKAIPANLHMNKINPKISFAKASSIFPDKLMAWNKNGKSRTAGVSSFGFSGTNAHLILEESPLVNDPEPAKVDVPLHILTLSAKNDAALKLLTQKYSKMLKDNHHIKAKDLCYTSNACRATFTHRAAFIGEDLKTLELKLDRFLEHDLSENDGTVFRGNAESNFEIKIAFFFDGYLENVERNARDLYETQPTFRKTMEKCDESFAPYLNHSLIKYLYSDNCDNEIYNQQMMKAACIFSLQFSLCTLWQSWGVEPTAVIGEKIGVFVAACTADIMPLETAVTCVSKIGKLLASQSSQMQDDAVFSHKQDIENALRNAEALSNCSNSRLLFISSAGGRPVKKQDIKDATFWSNEINGCSKLHNAIEYLDEHGYRAILDIGSLKSVKNKTDTYFTEYKGQYLQSILGTQSWNDLLGNAAKLFCSGVKINWELFYKHDSHKKIVLPTYPFQKKRYWVALKSELNDICSQKKEHYKEHHMERETEQPIEISGETEEKASYNTFVGKRVRTPLKNKILEYKISHKNLPALVDNHNILHAGYYQEMLCDMIKKIYDTNDYIIKNIRYMLFLLIPDRGVKKIQLLMEEKSNANINFKLYGFSDKKNDWDLHADGTIQLTSHRTYTEKHPESYNEIQNRCTKKYSHIGFYQMMEKHGYQSGETVKLIDEVWYKEGEALARFRNPGPAEDNMNYKIRIHPGILDACAQLYYSAFPARISENSVFMMAKWEDYSFGYNYKGDEFWGYVKLDKAEKRFGRIEGSFQLMDKKGNIVAKCRKAEMAELTDEMIGVFTPAIHEKNKEVDKTLMKADLIEKLKISSDHEREKYLSQYLRQTLSSALKMASGDIDTREPFMEYGMDSIVGIEFSKKISTELGIDVNFQLIITSETIEALSKTISDTFNIDDGRDANMEFKQFTDKIKINMEEAIERIKQDATLDNEIIVDKGVTPYDASREQKNVLLTGATGYLGVYLLKELLDKTNADIFCIVRANSKDHGMERIKEKMEAYQLWEIVPVERIIPIVGDISETRLGLDDNTYNEIINKTDAIYHTAANTNHVLSYESLKRVDAFSTLEIIKIACRVKVKPIYFVSTFGVPIIIRENKFEFSNEENIIRDLSGFNFSSGYLAGKWVSEQLLDQAYQRGIPMMIFRVGEMVGHSKTGVGRTDDMFVTLLRLFSASNFRTDYKNAIIDFVPVDYISQAIIYLAGQEKSIGNVYFLTNPEPSNFNIFFDVMEEVTQNKLKETNFEQWVSDCKENIDDVNDQKTSNVLKEYFTEKKDFGGLKYRFMFYFKNFHISNEKVMTALKGSGIECPPVTNALLKLYVDYFITCGFFKI